MVQASLFLATMLRKTGPWQSSFNTKRYRQAEKELHDVLPLWTPFRS